MSSSTITFAAVLAFTFAAAAIAPTRALAEPITATASVTGAESEKEACEAAFPAGVPAGSVCSCEESEAGSAFAERVWSCEVLERALLEQRPLIAVEAVLSGSAVGDHGMARMSLPEQEGLQIFVDGREVADGVREIRVRAGHRHIRAVRGDLVAEGTVEVRPGDFVKLEVDFGQPQSVATL